MKKVAIPRLGDSVAPCFEYSASVVIYTIKDGHVVEEIDFPLRSRDPFDRVRLLRSEQVDTIICGGLMERYEDLVKATGIEVISWVSGPVRDLLNLFLRGQLVPGSSHGQNEACGKAKP